MKTDINKKTHTVSCAFFLFYFFALNVFEFKSGFTLIDYIEIVYKQKKRTGETDSQKR